MEQGGGSVKITASENTLGSRRSGTLTVKTASGLTKTVQLQQEPSSNNSFSLESLRVSNESYGNITIVKPVVTFTVGEFEYSFSKEMNTATDVIAGEEPSSDLSGYWVSRIVISEETGSLTQYRFFGEILNTYTSDSFEVGDSNWHTFGQVNNVPTVPMDYPSWYFDMSSVTFEIK